MAQHGGALDLALEVADEQVRARAVEHCAAHGIALPTFAELSDPARLPAAARAALAGVDPDAPDPRNLFRVHWYNAADRRSLTAIPVHTLADARWSGIETPILFLHGDRFPLIGAHKVLPAYACLAPLLVTGRFDPARHRAVWPSTGNYCRGGVAISRILGCRGVAVLPEGMSAERFQWLRRWVLSPEDVIRTPGSESNVREIFEACDELAADPGNVILNQFERFENHLVHRKATGDAAERVFEHLRARRAKRGEAEPRLAAFVAASGSAGTLGAGSALAARHGAEVIVAEPAECPTLSENGYGSHNIQGIGDKHVPLIHDVMGTDGVAVVSDRATDELFALCNTDAGRTFLERERGLAPAEVDALEHFGLSSLCNLVASIQAARARGFGASDVVVTVATDGAALYRSELDRILRERFPHGFGPDEAPAVFRRHVLEAGPEPFLALDERERRRIFNLGYYTWVEQRGLPLEAFEARRSREFWDALPATLEAWDERIEAFERESGVRAGWQTTSA